MLLRLEILGDQSIEGYGFAVLAGELVGAVEDVRLDFLPGKLSGMLVRTDLWAKALAVDAIVELVNDPFSGLDAE